MEKIFVIAEAGVNHNGDPDLALELVEVASQAGANAVKFQLFNAREIVTEKAERAEYQKKNSGDNSSQLEMLKGLELPKEVHAELKKLSKRLGIEYMCTAFDSQSLDFLTDELDVDTLKIASGEITNAPFLLETAKKNKRIILSTGMSNSSEIKRALSILAFGLLDGEVPSVEAFKEAYNSNEGRSILKERVTILHCTSEYPAPHDQVNLAVIPMLQKEFDISVGYSDHTEGIQVAPLAAAIGARVIEKHFTLDKNMKGPDHFASIEPQELKQMMKELRGIEEILGSPIKKETPSERKNKDIVRKSLVAKKKILKGEKFSSVNITTKRPGIGKDPIEYWDMLGKASTKDYNADDLLEK